MSGLFKTPAPNSAFGLGGGNEDDSLGEMDQSKPEMREQPLAKHAVPTAPPSLGNGSAHASNGHAPSAEIVSKEPPTQVQAGAAEGRATAAADSASSATEMAEEAQLNGRDVLPPSQQDGAQHASAGSESDPTQTAAASAPAWQDGPGATSAPAASVAHSCAPQPAASDVQVAAGAGHGKDEEEHRIAQELAALEAEAEALVLQEQQQSGMGGSPGEAARAVGESGYSVPLSDAAADHAMAAARLMAQQVDAGTAAMQSSLDAYAPRARPFSPPPGSAPLARFSPVPDFQEPPQFRGLLYWDGVDAVGRPVIVVNADAVGEDKAARRAAMDYILHMLEPIVIRGPYVIVMVNNGRNQRSNRLPGSWFISAYRGLARPFRKNVKFIILVRPSKPLRALLALVRPFVSRKAHRKVVKVESLSAIGDATAGEVMLAHLGQGFAEAAGRHVSENLSLTSPTLRGGSSPPLASSPTGAVPQRVSF